MISSIISSIEKRYSFSSTASGLILVTYDIVVITTVLFVSYFGSKVHQPRLFGACLVLLGCGALLFASPQLFFGRYQVESSTTNSSQQLCFQPSAADECRSSTGNNIAYAIFIISNIIIGLASTPLYTIGFAYIDEIVYPKYVSLHIGAVAIVFVLGALVGFGFGSVFLSTYVDPWISTTLTQRDPSWVGAWWMPFLFIAIASFVLSIPFFMYPRYLPDSYLVKQERVKEMTRVYTDKYANENSTTVIFKMLPIHIKRLLLNPPFILSVLALSANYVFVQGVASFGPKLFEVQYGFSAFTAGLVVAAIGVPGGGTC